ncbi:Protein of unknown function [Pyronema omphalodes CBS 100304]|uniref:Uncharacterized protein n=1 Tax=Pyronema omphalodes (strain CBS 100304) TaxID=1076935 RepID=U4LU46_PYROM|nr:Protein of unknown function [Pyronema omphalodes CBS 100304]
MSSAQRRFVAHLLELRDCETSAKTTGSRMRLCLYRASVGLLPHLETFSSTSIEPPLLPHCLMYASMKFNHEPCRS